MSRTVADLTLGLSAQALAVLAMLAQNECDGLAEYDETGRDYKIEIRTSAWYNGRERGVCLEVRPSFSSKEALLITFGEHRNSDCIFIDSWRVVTHFLNPPTVADFSDEAYENRSTVPYGNVADAVSIIRDKIAEFITECSQPAPARVLPDLGEEETMPARVHGKPVNIPVPKPARAPADEPFKVSKTHNGGGTSLQGEFPASFAELQAKFGKPAYMATSKDPNSDGKVSTEWCFEGPNGEALTLYDYKETSLYDRGNPGPKAFRALPSYDWHVGARNKLTADRFIAWLRDQLGRAS